MPWQEVSILERRLEFVKLASQDGANISELARRFGVSRPTAYKWLGRYVEEVASSLADHSRRPHCSPARTNEAVEEAILAVREDHPAWGARLIRGNLLKDGWSNLPAASTVHSILVRNGKVDCEAAKLHGPHCRFEHEAPNEMWQMDFKGHFPMKHGRCHPFTILDDHSRFAIAVQACTDETAATVKAQLIRVFRQWGMPYRLLADNGGPWGYTQHMSHTRLSVWLMRLGIRVLHGRPCHPQTQGKLERFHRTLKAEAIQGICYTDLGHSQKGFDRFRHVYNNERPHTALNFSVPAQRYSMSTLAFPEVLPTIEYGPDDTVRIVTDKGQVRFKGREFRVGKAFHREPVAIRYTTIEGVFGVFFCNTQIAKIDLTESAD